MNPGSPTCKELVISQKQRYLVGDLFIKCANSILIHDANKNKVWNSIGDQYSNNYLVYNIKHKIFSDVSNDVIIGRFQNIETCRGYLQMNDVYL